jgi:hypothetical protein
MTATIARDAVFKENDKWFFYAEDWASVYGPFDTEAIARFALYQYCKECL